ncbi:MAG: EAL domain-containing protein [Pseudomonadota bacterium]
MSSLPKSILDQVPLKRAEGLALALASDTDGAIMILKWCNLAFSRITGYERQEVIGQRGTILIGRDTEQAIHLQIIEKLMNWEAFSVNTQTNHKDGKKLFVRMGWTPLSDSLGGDRWWLCSLIEIDNQKAVTLLEEPGHDQVDNPKLQEAARTEIVRLERENKRLRELATSVSRESHEDPLTGLSNRRHLELELNEHLARLRQRGKEFAVIFVDLDRFKSVNDTLGHEAGDALLVSVAKALRQMSDKDDIVARLGGDEFVVLRPLGVSALNISGLADAIIFELGKKFSFEGRAISRSASVGVAIATKDMKSPEQIMVDADAALYHAKANGRGRWSYFTSEMHAEAIATKELATELLDACERREFIPYFQPIVNAETGLVSCAEVLVRWQHPKRGLLQPADFLDVAGKIGIEDKIDAIIFEKIAEQLKEIDATGIELPKLSINISAARLANPSLIHDIKVSKIDPKRLTIEILESVYLEDEGNFLLSALSDLSDLGVSIAVDDFGTGHASVQGLLSIKPSILKIDRQFLMSAFENDSAMSLFASIVSIGKSLNIKVIAEGVETEQHGELAVKLGCDFLQGFFLGRPVDAGRFRELQMQTRGAVWCQNRKLSYLTKH